MQYRPRIDRRRRSIDKKPPNPSRKQGRKTERSGLGFFSSNPEHALPLQRGVERFHYCELSSGQVSRSFLIVLGHPVDLMYSQNRGTGSCRLDIHLERSNSLVGLVYTIGGANLVSSMRIAKKVANLVHLSYSCLPG